MARAHARTGEAAAISGYLGNGDVFDQVICNFALLYTDQTELDHQALEIAVKTGQIVVETGI